MWRALNWTRESFIMPSTHRAEHFTLQAGMGAAEVIQQQGLSSDLIGSMVGASGGPKWLILSALDQMLAGEFFKDRRKPIYTLGSSAGAWRHIAYGVSDKVSAIQRFEQAYIQQRYETTPSPAEVTQEGRKILAEVLGANGISELIHNPIWKTNLSVVRSKGLLASENKILLGTGLLATALGNLSSRDRLRYFFERAGFSPGGGQGGGFHFDDFVTHQIPLTERNMLDAILASGSIPLVMEGVRNIEGAPNGMYRDGGFIDYHFDFKFDAPEGLILYPHFYSHLSAGWFDKFTPWRRVSSSNLDRVVMISPSKSLVASLPDGKIPDRDDFKNLDNDSRIARWTQVVEQGKKMADEFYECWQKGVLAELVVPFDLK